MKLKEPTLESVTTINEDGSRYFLHPADVGGRFTLWRRIFALGLVAIYVLLPWIKINGFPAVFLDVMERRFHLFGFTFATEDIWLGFFVITGLGFSLFYVTALFGRLWCGWACPYTVFLEHIFRRIERIIDGDAAARRRLEDAPWKGDKIRKRIVKHALFIVLSSLIAHVFLSYFVSLPKLYGMVTASPAEHLKEFGIVTFLTGALYFSFAWFREQFCIIMCPYGRIQSALTDDNTLVIGYDAGRGEPRGKASDKTAGDCIDCHRCVNVCPTGIDIRNGLQVECIGCAGCIDACDAIMEKVGRPKGLIRYDSMMGLAARKTRWLRPRIFVYTLFLAVGVVVMSVSLAKVKPAQASVVRMMGAPFYVTEDNVRNQFQIRFLNKRTIPSTFRLTVEGAPEGFRVMGFEEEKQIDPMAEEMHTMIIEMARAHYTGKFPFRLKVVSQPGDVEIEREVDFLGPDPRLFEEEEKEKGPKE